MLQHKIHFIGIGGAGMSGLARILLARNVAVSGSDLHESEITGGLEALGARIYIGHAAEHIRQEQPTEVVISSAVPDDNPELSFARAQGIPVLSRATMLARLMQEQTGIAIAGTHGKTTVTSMLALIVEQAGLDPTIVIGGELHDIGSNAKLGRGPHFIAEADESDRSFLLLSPRVAVVTNVEADHLENYGTLREIVQTFRIFLARLPADGLAVLCADDVHAASLAPLHCEHVTYGFSEGADYRATDVRLLPLGSEAHIYEGDAFLGKLSLQVPGTHNIANALAAVAVARRIGVEFDKIARSLRGFRGAKRRFDILGEPRGVLIVDDYAHHPTEIRVTLTAARNTGRRVIAVFQPHRYSRTKALLDELAASFGEADHIVLTDIYAAMEEPLPDMSTERVANALRKTEGDKLTVIRDKTAIAGYLLAHTRSGDVVVTMGAGDVRMVGEDLLSMLSIQAPLVAHVTGPTAVDPDGRQ